jgi:lipopolysaccharide assembly outer membrane protein LptD (OstA)
MTGKRFPSKIKNPCLAGRQEKSKIKITIQNLKFWILIYNFAFCILHFTFFCYAQEDKGRSVVVNADHVELSTDKKEVIATGNVEAFYKGAKLTCQKLTLNTQTKNGLAEGNARLDDQKGVIEGPKISYNFETKTGTIMEAEFRANPYFGKARKVDKVSDVEFIARRGYFTTCSFDRPHYRIVSKKLNVFPEDKIQSKEDIFYLGKVPLFYIPQYNHSLKDPLVHVQLVPGKSKDYGVFLLTGWRYNLTDNVSGRIYLDYREKLGVAEGFGTNYKTKDFGKGDFKYYYTQERTKGLEEGMPAEFQRYFIRMRHKWDIDEQTNLTSQYYKIVDSKRAVLGSEYNFLKDYFFREYEKDPQPLSYVLMHHAFNYSSMDFIIQKRTNRWYTPPQLEKLPEVKYSLPSRQIGETPFYFENNSSLGNYNKKNTSTSTPQTNADTPDVHVNRLDATNKFSLPMKVAFLQVTPFVSSRQTFYDKDTQASSVVRNIFYSGLDMSTKFYRPFNIKPRFLGIEINGLRHIITPTVGYAYNHEPTNIHLRQIDSVDSISRSNAASLGLSNKLQTKRKGQSVDLLDFNVTNTYTFKPKTQDKRGSSLSDFLFTIKLLPYSWLRINGDATYKHSGNRSVEGYHRFTNANYNFNFDFGQERTIGLGQRYQRKGGNEITLDIDWRLTPKWKFGFYQRRNRGHDPTLKRGLREQEYFISRDLHCWTIEATYNVSRGHGETIWLIFRLKAFPELEFEYNQAYHVPKPGSQSNP